MSDGDRDRLLEEIARSRARVAELEAARDSEVRRIERLEAESAALEAIPVELRANVLADLVAPRSEAPAQASTPRAPQEKLEIFRRLFRGRPDVYPTRFESAKGKQGYGPACANKFVKGDAAYRSHLLGDHVMGVYVDHAVPMLARMFAKRLRGYRSIGYARGEAPLGYAEPKQITIEYDADIDHDAEV